jgi:hypothetical protein
MGVNLRKNLGNFILTAPGDGMCLLYGMMDPGASWMIRHEEPPALPGFCSFLPKLPPLFGSFADNISASNHNIRTFNAAANGYDHFPGTAFDFFSWQVFRSTLGTREGLISQYEDGVARLEDLGLFDFEFSIALFTYQWDQHFQFLSADDLGFVQQTISNCPDSNMGLW